MPCACAGNQNRVAALRLVAEYDPKKKKEKKEKKKLGKLKSKKKLDKLKSKKNFK